MTHNQRDQNKAYWFNFKSCIESEYLNKFN